MKIIPSARKHGISDEDILHAVRHPIRSFLQDDRRQLIIAADRAGRLLEVVIKDPDDDDARVIHAMELRPTFYRLLQ